MYKTTNFNIHELVHPRIIQAIGEHLSWQRLDALCLMDLDLIRERWGSSIYINTGKYDSRGLRPPNDGDGAMYSLHKQGKAFDLVPKNKDTRGLWEMVYDMANDNELRAINTLESLAFTPIWVHIANCNTSEKPLIISP